MDSGCYRKGSVMAQPSAPVTIKRAADIMGSNFIGIDALQHLGVELPPKSKDMFRSVPFSAEVLEQYASTDALVACGALSLQDVLQSCNGLFATKHEVWYQQERFARAKVRPGWYLVRKDEVPGYTFKTWNKHQTLLGPDEQVPSASVLAQTILFTFMETKERLFEMIYVRSSDVDSRGRQVVLGRFGQDGLCISSLWDGGRRGGIGLASSRESS